MRHRGTGLFSDMLRQSDLVLFALCSIATFYGMLLILSATHTVYNGSLKYVAVQGVGYLLGSFLYFMLSSLDIVELSKKWKWILGFNVGFILLLLTPLGMVRNGNRAWLGVNDLGRKYGVGFLANFPFYIQPAEIVKITFIILLAKQLSYLREEHDLKRFANVVQPTAHVMFMFALYYVISRDAGSGLVYLFAFVCMAFTAGMAARWLILGLGGVAGGLVAAWHFNLLRGDWYKRIAVVLDHSFDAQGKGWQQTRGLLALGSGGWTGQGLFHGTQSQSPYRSSLPERQTDFIFCVCGEELGFVGCAFIIVLLLAIVIRCFLVARDATTRMESLVCVGMAGMLIFQTVMNIGMCLFLLPVVGLTLPFFSYGGTSVMTLFAAMGVVSGIKKRSRPEWLMNS
ncbi:MAG: FtsW/RodA/SpoVE family cell cycle protein [Oscillospiraceae bacterium]|nr:FtsW/RodA/SpoVE family cell cycle protein [Oscillospiraceae bacterium]